jgi:hypothetical protein
MADRFEGDYAWYKRGQNGERHDNTPPFEPNEVGGQLQIDLLSPSLTRAQNGEVKLAPGELYCRHATKPGSLCLNKQVNYYFINFNPMPNQLQYLDTILQRVKPKGSYQATLACSRDPAPREQQRGGSDWRR